MSTGSQETHGLNRRVKKQKLIYNSSSVAAKEITKAPSPQPPHGEVAVGPEKTPSEQKVGSAALCTITTDRVQLPKRDEATECRSVTLGTLGQQKSSHRHLSAAAHGL